MIERGGLSLTMVSSIARKLTWPYFGDRSTLWPKNTPIGMSPLPVSIACTVSSRRDSIRFIERGNGQAMVPNSALYDKRTCHVLLTGRKISSSNLKPCADDQFPIIETGL